MVLTQFFLTRDGAVNERHSETQEAMVLYRAEYGERQLWVRPLDMFIESVNVDGKRVPRFEYVGD